MAMPGAALGWRISRHLAPADAGRIDTDHAHATTRTLRLDEMLGPDRAADLPNAQLGALSQRLSPDATCGGLAVYRQK
jgi:hypothetical protein